MLSSLAGLVYVVTTYLLVGPLPCSRSYASRCGLAAFDYPGDTGLFPGQALVAMTIAGVVASLTTWFSLEHERSPRAIKFGGVALIVATVGLANAGVGGLIGIGVPLVLPLLWLLARWSQTQLRWLWVTLSGLSAMTGSWMLAALFQRPWTFGIALTTGIGVLILFALTTRSAEGRTDEVG